MSLLVHDYFVIVLIVGLVVSLAVHVAGRVLGNHRMRWIGLGPLPIAVVVLWMALVVVGGWWR